MQTRDNWVVNKVFAAAIHPKRSARRLNNPEKPGAKVVQRWRKPGTLFVNKDLTKTFAANVGYFK